MEFKESKNHNKGIISLKDKANKLVGFGVYHSVSYKKSEHGPYVVEIKLLNNNGEFMTLELSEELINLLSEDLERNQEAGVADQFKFDLIEKALDKAKGES